MYDFMIDFCRNGFKFYWLPGQDKKLILEKKSVSQVTYMFMLYYCRYFDEIFTAMLLVFHCCCYTWAIVR